LSRREKANRHEIAIALSSGEQESACLFHHRSSGMPQIASSFWRRNAIARR
jgi:hypothetical protein